MAYSVLLLKEGDAESIDETEKCYLEEWSTQKDSLQEGFHILDGMRGKEATL